MTADPVANSLKRPWREQSGWRLESSNGPTPTASFDRSPEHRDPDPPPAVAPARWPRVFPGL